MSPSPYFPSTERCHSSLFPLRYHLLKLLQKFGKVKQFDFLFHKSGALEGQPRGYCFVNFETKQVRCFLVSREWLLPHLFYVNIKLKQEGINEIPRLQKP